MLKPYYEQDGITIYNGDCREVLPQLPPLDHAIFDPPYGAHVHSKQWVASALTKGRARFSGAGLKTELGFDALTDELRSCVANAVARTTRWVLVFSDIEGCHLWRAELERAGLDYTRTGIWHKPDAAPQFTGDRPGSGAEAVTICHAKGRKRWNGGGHHAVWEHYVNNYGRTERLHPTPKPESLMNELVSLFTDAGDVILDPFMGSGTTLVAAKRLGRKAIGIELEEKYCEISAKRLQQGALPLEMEREMCL